MNTELFIAKIKDWSTRYKKLYFEPLEKFKQEYEKENPLFLKEQNGLKNYHIAIKEFGSQITEKENLDKEFFNFIDENFDTYLNTKPEEQRNIRIATSNSYFINNKGEITRFAEDLLLQYVREHAIPKIQNTGDKKYLLAGLVAICLENSGVDYRDTLIHLADLYIATDEKGLEPELHFQEIAKICDSELPRGGFTPMNKLMTSISSSAILNERKAKKI